HRRMRFAAHQLRDHIGVDDDHGSNDGGASTYSDGGSSRSTPPERCKAPADRLGKVRLRRIAIAGHGLAENCPRFGFHRSAVAGRAHAQPLFDRRIDIADRQGRHRCLDLIHAVITYKTLALNASLKLTF
ncbi:MAG: hypothetical protein WA184_24060, partial [Stellaceae bacterium]